jgi:hypothetical protein
LRRPKTVLMAKTMFGASKANRAAPGPGM